MDVVVVDPGIDIDVLVERIVDGEGHGLEEAAAVAAGRCDYRTALLGRSRGGGIAERYSRRLLNVADPRIYGSIVETVPRLEGVVLLVVVSAREGPLVDGIFAACPEPVLNLGRQVAEVVRNADDIITQRGLAVGKRVGRIVELDVQPAAVERKRSRRGRRLRVITGVPPARESPHVLALDGPLLIV